MCKMKEGNEILGIGYQELDEVIFTYTIFTLNPNRILQSKIF